MVQFCFICQTSLSIRRNPFENVSHPYAISLTISGRLLKPKTSQMEADDKYNLGLLRKKFQPHEKMANRKNRPISF